MGASGSPVAQLRILQQFPRSEPLQGSISRTTRETCGLIIPGILSPKPAAGSTGMLRQPGTGRCGGAIRPRCGFRARPALNRSFRSRTPSRCVNGSRPHIAASPKGVLGRVGQAVAGFAAVQVPAPDSPVDFTKTVHIDVGDSPDVSLHHPGSGDGQHHGGAGREEEVASGVRSVRSMVDTFLKQISGQVRTGLIRTGQHPEGRPRRPPGRFRRTGPVESYGCIP